MRLLPLLLLTLLGPAAAADFRTEQKRFPRVRGAYEHFEKKVPALFKTAGVAYPPRQIFLRAFKRERRLELWARDAESKAFSLIKTFSVCALSGDLGPKWKAGDGQIPEGVYTISGFNPQSSYHLSLRVSYPSAEDRKRSTHAKLGGDIFVHGDCVTIGCLPLKDEGIEELYMIAVDTKAASGATIPIHIFPTPLTERGMEQLATEYKSRPKLLEFWKSLVSTYAAFEATKRL